MKDILKIITLNNIKFFKILLYLRPYVFFVFKTNKNNYFKFFYSGTRNFFINVNPNTS